MLTLHAEQRNTSPKPSSLRKEGLLPAVLYGPKEDTVALSVSQKEFGIVWKEAGGSSVIELETPNGKKSALIHAVQFDPVLGNPIHADFYVIEKGKELEVPVPLEFIGVAPAVKDLGGTLVKVLREIIVKGVPTDIPHSIEVDVSSLIDLESQILVSSISLPSGVNVVGDEESVIASIATVEEEPEEEKEEADISSIEVEKKGKEEEDPSAQAGGEEEASS
ncbi:MAG: 50S ribosomal protein L25 [Patescibacteria group bacterium]|nr:MAG: 50S ribosomal protein L25 [Patescibacteria group bacterium]